MNGIYRAEFSSVLGRGSGTVYLDKNTIKGGDSMIAYYGNYQVADNNITGEISLIKHGSGSSVFGPATEIILSGTLHGNRIIGKGSTANAPLQADIVLTKIKEL